MTTPPYDIGDQRRCTGLFVDVNNDPVNPTTGTFTLREPDGALITKTLAEISNPATGTFIYDHTIAKPGRHVYRFAGTAGTVASGSAEFWGRHRNAVA